MTYAQAAAVLEADSVRFQYRRRGPEVLPGLSMTVAGRVAAVLGPNGAGKSTLLSLVTGARRVQSGSLRVVGLNLAEPAQRRELQLKLGFVPQAMGIFPGYSVEQFLQYACWLRKVPAKRQFQAVEEALTATDLQRFRRQKIRVLSGGTRQRAKVAQALVNSPRLLVLDEPTVGLDPDQRADFLELVLRLRDRAPILLATHLVEDVARVCDQVVVMREGTAMFTGPVTELAGVRPGAEVSGPAVEAGYRRTVRSPRAS